MEIREEASVGKYLAKHSFLLPQYKKVKSYLESNNFLSSTFKKRSPKSENIYQFRITKKYRGFGYFHKDGFFVVTEINDHQ